jgi:hypothetical protein
MNAGRAFALFLPDTNALFLHIPRTGGTTVKDTIINRLKLPHEVWKGCTDNKCYPRKHTLLAQHNPRLLEKVKFVFCFVRHPLSYYQSIWKYTSTVNEQGKYIHPDDRREGTQRKFTSIRWEYPTCWCPDFDEWVTTMVSEYPGWVTRLYEGFVGPDHSEFCHFIGRTETLSEDLYACLRYYLEYDIKRKDVTGSRKMNRSFDVPELTEESSKMISESERLAVSRFYGEKTTTKRIYRDTHYDRRRGR